MNIKSYSIVVVLGTLGLLFLAALFNRIVDPFWYFRDVNIPGFNIHKPNFILHERQVKPVILKETNPQALIFGSSFSEVGFDPLHPAITDNGKLRVYNFAMRGAHWNLVLCHVEYALDHATPRRVVIGIHLEAMPSVDCRPRLAEMDVSMPAFLLSLDTLLASWKTVTSQGKDVMVTREGQFFYLRYKADMVEQLYREDFSMRISELGSKTCMSQSPEVLYALHKELPQWSDVEGGQDPDLTGLAGLLDKLDQKQVETKLVVYPNHALPMELYILCGEGMARWRILWRIAQLVDGHRAHGAPIELWDFQGFSPFITERIRNKQTRYWQDAGHFNYEMGDVMLNIMFHRDPGLSAQDADSFGVMATAGNVPKLFEQFHRNRQLFLENNPWFHRDLQQQLKFLAVNPKKAE